VISYEQYLRTAAVTKETIDTFLDPSASTWAKFDPELGYVLDNSLQHDGLDGCFTISTVQENGARTASAYANRPCRINTYGNSFTQCHQVSDGETWQEYLAAHLGEPIRNFGMGGFGFYQAYRRMIRTEKTAHGAQYVLLYIWGDDHMRSVMRCRHATTYPWGKLQGGLFFHGNFWANIEMDLDSGRLVEKENILPTLESLYRMTDPDFMVDALRDDLMVQLYTLEDGYCDPASIDHGRLNALAETLGVGGIDENSPDDLKVSVPRIKNAYGFAATKNVIEKAVRFCRANRKGLLIMLICPRATRQLLRKEPRYDQEIVRYLDDKGVKYFDMNTVHFRDYQSFDVSVDDYMKRYYIGHYGPSGNHFFAYSIKDTVVELLDPKPITYRDDGSRVVDFKGYAPGLLPGAPKGPI